MVVNQRTKEKRRVKKKKKNVSIVHIMTILFIVYFGFTFFNQQLKLNKYNPQIEMYEKEIESKQNLIEYYKSRKENITTDEYIESVAREKLGLVKPYEKVYIDANN